MTPEENKEVNVATVLSLVLFGIILGTAFLTGCPTAKGEVLAFTATWCGPCREMHPIVDSAKASGADIRFIDVDQHPELKERYKVGSIPCFVQVENGREVDRITGSTTARELIRISGQVRVSRTAGNDAHCRIWTDDGGGQRSGGSGVLIDRNDQAGLILTCSHTFNDTKSNLCIVEFPNGKRFQARIIEQDKGNDLAALVIQRPDIEPLKVDDSTPSGSLTVCGFGAFKEGFRQSTANIVEWVTPQGASSQCAVIQTAARSGDSGGAVLNASGCVVGVIWGSRDGRAYLTCDKPLRTFLGRVLNNRKQPRPFTPAASPQPQPGAQSQLPPPPHAAPPGAIGCKCGCVQKWEAFAAWRSEFEQLMAERDKQIAALQVQVNANANATVDGTTPKPSTLNFLGAQNKVIATATVTPGQTSNVTLPPFHIRVIDPRGANYSTEFQSVYQGQYVKLPFGPAQ